MPVITLEDANAYYHRVTPGGPEEAMQLVRLERGFAVGRLAISKLHMRPGNLISGPTQMTAADSLSFMAIASVKGLVDMMVTSNLSIDFLRPCIGEALEAEARLLKAGRTLSTAQVTIRGVGQDEPSAVSLVTYIMPPEKR